MNSVTEKPWGSFEILKSGKKFLVKKIFVKPGGVLSLQSHEHRSEHWIVAEGEAEVTIDKKVINLKENDSIAAVAKVVHDDDDVQDLEDIDVNITDQSSDEKNNDLN